MRHFVFALAVSCSTAMIYVVSVYVLGIAVSLELFWFIDIRRVDPFLRFVIAAMFLFVAFSSFVIALNVSIMEDK